ncbi:MAG: hypothetical protein V7K23_23150 [Nostoc sp.]
MNKLTGKFATLAIAPYARLEKLAFDIIFLVSTGTVLDVEGGYSA